MTQARSDRAARLLGWAGVVPFAALAVAAWFPDRAPWANAAFVAYSAVILSFLGGVRWGRALERTDWLEYLRAVLPSLVAWVALLAMGDAAVPVLAAAFVAVWLSDVLYDSLPAPAWFRGLRSGLTGAVLACHVVVLAARLAA